MTTFTFRNGNNLSVADDYSNTDTIIVGNDVNDTLSADYSKYDKITLGNGASDTVFAGSVTGGTDTGTAIFGNLFQMTQFFALSSGSARMRKAALVSILVSIITISWPVHAQTLDQVIREYQGAFGTVPDQAGLAFWVQAIDDGTASFATLSVAFANSPQFQATYGASANTPASVSLVQAFYQHCFRETLPATDPGVQFWANSSLTASQLLQAFAQSPQFINSAAPYIIGFQNLEAAGTPPTPPTSLFALATPPFNMQLPVITGTAQVGRVLTSSTGTWTGATSFAYQWAGNGTPIAGATALTYTPVSSDAGNTLTATVTATGPGGTASATSAPTVSIVAASGGGGSGVCPQGTAYVAAGDGCQNAHAAGHIQSNFFTSFVTSNGSGGTVNYGRRPPWNVAGVDYPVGVSGQLLNPVGNLPSCATISGNKVNINAASADCTVQNFDFTLSPGPYCLAISGSGGHTVTINNVNLSFSSCNISVSGNANVILEYSSVIFTTANNYVMQPNNTGASILVQYNYFYEPTRIEFTGSAFNSSITNRYNFMDGMQPKGSVHAETVYLGTPNVVPLMNESWNVYYQRWTDGTQSCFLYIVSGFGAAGEGYITTAIDTYNVLVSRTSSTNGAIVMMGGNPLGTQITNYTLSNNWYDDTGNYMFLDVQAPTQFIGPAPSCTGNVNLLNGTTYTQTSSAETGSIVCH